MKKEEIIADLKEIKVLSFRLRMALNTIDRDEFINLTSKLDRKIERLIEMAEKD